MFMKGDVLPLQTLESMELPDNQDLEIKDVCQDFLAILASSLAKIDYRLSNPDFKGDLKQCTEVRKLKFVYKKFVNRFLKVG